MSSYPLKHTPELVLCCYINTSNKIEVGRIKNIPNWYFERVIFPGQRIIFEAPLEGDLEIHTGEMINAIHSETIHCRELHLTSTFPVYSYQ